MLGIAPATSLAAVPKVKPIGEPAWPPGEVDLLGHSVLIAPAGGTSHSIE